jgi:hypothetical protein
MTIAHFVGVLCGDGVLLPRLERRVGDDCCIRPHVSKCLPTAYVIPCRRQSPTCDSVGRTDYGRLPLAAVVCALVDHGTQTIADRDRRDRAVDSRRWRNDDT